VASFILFAATAAWPDSLVLVTSHSGQGANDSVLWSQLGADATTLGSGFTAKSAGGITTTVSLTGSNSLTAVVCSASPCSWVGTGLAAKDTLIWTSNTGNRGNGPVTLTFGAAVSGAGALAQANAPGQFTAQIQAFNGSTSLGTFTEKSDASGDAIYIGVVDQTGANITKLIFSLTSCGPEDSSGCTDFGIDTLSLKAGAPAVSLSPSSLTFATQLLNTSSSVRKVTLTNAGTATLTITNISTSGDFSQTNTCGSSVASGKNCTFSVTFKPTAIGTRSGSISITDNAPGGPQKITLNGTGTEIKLSPASLTFAAQVLKTKSKSQSITATNIGASSFSLTSISLTGSDPGDFAQTHTCGSTLNAGASCTITVTFTPTAINTRTANVSVSDTGGGSPQTVTLRGTGTQVQLSATSLTFPTTKVSNSSAPQTVMLTNVGSTTLSVTSIALGGTDPTDFSEINTCGSSVGAGKNCTLTIKFQPKATGTRTANVSITDNGGASPHQISLTGTGD